MKLTHLEHIEDNLMQYPEQVLQLLHNIETCNANVSLKWDGAPAIIFGTDTFNNKFFLSTKSLFNKNPKVNYSCSDIMLNHGDNYPLACKLMYAFTLLKENYTDRTIVQADMLFCKSEVDFSNGDCPRFTPNTLTYEMRGGIDISNVMLGLVIHTKYQYTDFSATSLQELSAFPYKYKGSMGDKIWIAGTDVNYTIYDFDITRSLIHTKALIEHRDSQFVQAKIIDTSVYADYKIFYNSCIREVDRNTSFAKWDTHWKRFIDWSIDRFAASIKKLKTPAGMKNHLYELDARMLLLHDSKVIEHFQQMVITRDYINALKTTICRSLQNASSVRALFEDQYCDHEGYVVTSTDGTMMKIVNRREFSARNFNKNKGGNFENSGG